MPPGVKNLKNLKNIRAKVSDKTGKILFSIDPALDFGPSTSGASMIVASSGGFIDLAALLDNPEYEGYGLNLIVSRKVKKGGAKKEEKPATRRRKVEEETEEKPSPKTRTRRRSANTEPAKEEKAGRRRRA